MLAAIHLHVLHHTLDPFGIVVAALALFVAVAGVSLIAAWLIRRRTA